MFLKKYTTLIFIVLIALIGIFMRVYFYALDRSLWYDEVRLAYSIVNRSFSGLFQPLEYKQVAPIGFLLFEKVSVAALGTSDYVLRLLPLVSGIVSVFLMFLLLKRWGKGISPLVAFGLFSLSERLVRFSSELKQYSTDVAVTLLLLVFASQCFENKRATPLVTLGLVGAFSLWFSYPSIFVLAGIGIALGSEVLQDKARTGVLRLVGVAFLWMLSFAVFYIVSLRTSVSDDYLISYWSSYFMPWPPWKDMGWHMNAWIELLRNPARLPPIVFTLVILVFGWISLLVRKWQVAVLFIVTFMTALVASSMKKYPFGERVMLFSLPLLFFLLAEGIERIRSLFKRFGALPSILSSILLCAFFLLHPMYMAYSNVIHPKMGEDIKPVMNYLREKHREDDLIYLYYAAHPAFQYYASRYGFTEDEYVVGIKSKEEPSRYTQDLNRLSGGQRAWVVFSHNCTTCILDEKLYMLLHLNKVGTKKDEFKSDDASVYLYELRSKP